MHCLPCCPWQVGLRDAFVSADWDGSPSLFFAHDYHPGAAQPLWRSLFGGLIIACFRCPVPGTRLLLSQTLVAARHSIPAQPPCTPTACAPCRLLQPGAGTHHAHPDASGQSGRLLLPRQPTCRPHPQPAVSTRSKCLATMCAFTPSIPTPAHPLPAPLTCQQGLMRNPANEEQLWSYLVQLTSALRCIHSAGLAARPGCLMPSKARGERLPGVASAAQCCALCCGQHPCAARLNCASLRVSEPPLLHSTCHSCRCW